MMADCVRPSEAVWARPALVTREQNLQSETRHHGSSHHDSQIARLKKLNAHIQRRRVVEAEAPAADDTAYFMAISPVGGAHFFFQIAPFL